MSEHQNSYLNGHGGKSFTNMDNNNPNARTLYVGNLDAGADESFIRMIFSQLGQITNLKMMKEGGNKDHYCFIEYSDHQSATNVLNSMNRRKLFDREIKVNWATSPSNATHKQDINKHFNIFVGDLCPEVESETLREAFSKFGEIVDCRIVRDPGTNKSKNYGFVTFYQRDDAEQAITEMNGKYVGSRAIRTNWAQRKLNNNNNSHSIGRNVDHAGNANCGNGKLKNGPIGPSLVTRANFEEVYNQTGPHNTSVYCGGISSGVTEEMLSKRFATFGQITDVKVFRDKGYAFVRFLSKEAAANAIISMNNVDLYGQQIKCSWGKESADAQMAVAAALQAQFAQAPYYYGSMPFWYTTPQATPTGANPYTTSMYLPNIAQYGQVLSPTNNPYSQYYPQQHQQTIGSGYGSPPPAQLPPGIAHPQLYHPNHQQQLSTAQSSTQSPPGHAHNMSGAYD